MTPSPWKYFSLEELKCHCGKCGSTGAEMDDTFMEWVVALREACNFPFIVSSAYRCPAYNNEISHTGFNGPHTTKKAMDIACSGIQSMQIEKAALNAGVKGKGCNQKGDGRFIHLDMCGPEDNLPRPANWSY
jgi:zinc D-Ala-D-Ala carboxypeptidase